MSPRPGEYAQGPEHAVSWWWLIAEGELGALPRGLAARNVVRGERLAAAATQAYNVSV